MRRGPTFPRGLPLAAAFAAAAALACTPDPVQWQPERRSQSTLTPEARLTLAGGDMPTVVGAWTPELPPTSASQCAGSVSATLARGDTAFAAWWALRADSTAALVVARSDDGGRHWGAAVTADSADRGHTGCRRLPPSIGADSLNGYVHVVYFMQAPEGPGLFFTHSMDAGRMFHAPVAIVYGERASAAAVSSRGDTVVVAYENPNAAAPQVWLALSRSQGHIFEHRLSVSTATARGENPAVVVRDGRVAIAWNETGRGGGPVATVMLVGVLRW
jgi:hypothetical protein